MGGWWFQLGSFDEAEGMAEGAEGLMVLEQSAEWRWRVQRVCRAWCVCGDAVLIDRELSQLCFCGPSCLI